MFYLIEHSPREKLKRDMSFLIEAHLEIFDDFNDSHLHLHEPKALP